MPEPLMKYASRCLAPSTVSRQTRPRAGALTFAVIMELLMATLLQLVPLPLWIWAVATGTVVVIFLGFEMTKKA